MQNGVSLQIFGLDFRGGICSRELLLVCCMELVERLRTFPYSGPSGILCSDTEQKTA